MDRTKGVRNIAACAVVGIAMAGPPMAPASNAAYADSGFVAYNGNSLGTGSMRNPVQVWRGWAGPGKYYLFAAMRLETSAPVESVQELNGDNVAVYGRNLSGPYTRMLRRGPVVAVHGFQRGVLPNPNAPQEQKPSIPMMALPKVSSDRNKHFSQTDKNIILFTGELAAFWGLLWIMKRMKELKN